MVPRFTTLKRQPTSRKSIQPGPTIDNKLSGQATQTEIALPGADTPKGNIRVAATLFYGTCEAYANSMVWATRPLATTTLAQAFVGLVDVLVQWKADRHLTDYEKLAAYAAGTYMATHASARLIGISSGGMLGTTRFVRFLLNEAFRQVGKFCCKDYCATEDLIQLVKNPEFVRVVDDCVTWGFTMYAAGRAIKIALAPDSVDSRAATGKYNTVYAWDASLMAQGAPIVGCLSYFIGCCYAKWKSGKLILKPDAHPTVKQVRAGIYHRLGAAKEAFGATVKLLGTSFPGLPATVVSGLAAAVALWMKQHNVAPPVQAIVNGYFAGVIINPVAEVWGAGKRARQIPPELQAQLSHLIVLVDQGKHAAATDGERAQARWIIKKAKALITRRVPRESHGPYSAEMPPDAKFWKEGARSAHKRLTDIHTPGSQLGDSLRRVSSSFGMLCTGLVMQQLISLAQRDVVVMAPQDWDVADLTHNDWNQFGDWNALLKMVTLGIGAPCLVMLIESLASRNFGSAPEAPPIYSLVPGAAAMAAERTEDLRDGHPEDEGREVEAHKARKAAQDAEQWARRAQEAIKNGDENARAEAEEEMFLAAEVAGAGNLRDRYVSPSRDHVAGNSYVRMVNTGVVVGSMTTADPALGVMSTLISHGVVEASRGKNPCDRVTQSLANFCGRCVELFSRSPRDVRQAPEQPQGIDEEERGTEDVPLTRIHTSPNRTPETTPSSSTRGQKKEKDDNGEGMG